MILKFANDFSDWSIVLIFIQGIKDRIDDIMFPIVELKR
ncbi:unknow [Vibrio parahaemolyticus]|nr:unknow [Vibrio parahaemolyticus]